MKSTTIILMMSLLAISCSKKFDVSDYFDPSLPFEIIDMEHPSGVRSETEIQMNDSKHDKLVSWLKSNNDNWKKSPKNTHAGLIIVRQGDFHILFYRDRDFIMRRIHR